MAGDAKKLQPIIIKRVKKGGHGMVALVDCVCRLRDGHDGLFC